MLLLLAATGLPGLPLPGVAGGGLASDGGDSGFESAAGCADGQRLPIGEARYRLSTLLLWLARSDRHG